MPAQHFSGRSQPFLRFFSGLPSGQLSRKLLMRLQTVPAGHSSQRTTGGPPQPASLGLKLLMGLMGMPLGGNPEENSDIFDYR